MVLEKGLKNVTQVKLGVLKKGRILPAPHQHILKNKKTPAS